MRLGAVAALMFAATASAAAAQSPELLECSTAAMPAEERARLAAAMLAGDQANGRPLVEHLAQVAATCAERHQLSAEQGPAYFDYSIARVPHDAFASKLAEQGISNQLIDRALDFGEGRSNPVISGDLSGEQLDQLMTALTGSGVVTQNLGQSTWEMIGGYAAATSLMWQARAKLR